MALPTGCRHGGGHRHTMGAASLPLFILEFIQTWSDQSEKVSLLKLTRADSEDARGVGIGIRKRGGGGTGGKRGGGGWRR